MALSAGRGGKNRLTAKYLYTGVGNRPLLWTRQRGRALVERAPASLPCLSQGAEETFAAVVAGARCADGLEAFAS